MAVAVMATASKASAMGKISAPFSDGIAAKPAVVSKNTVPAESANVLWNEPDATTSTPNGQSPRPGVQP